jgi:quercetin dioxygenase-like cupin family protein
MNIKMTSAILVLSLLASFSAAQEAVKDTAPAAKNYTIENCINQFNKNKSVKTSVGYQYWFIPQDFLPDGLTVKMSVAGPHQATHPPHKHKGDEIFFVLEGTAKFYLNGKTTTGGANTSFYCPDGSEHGISNVGDTELKYLVIRKYLKE